MDKAQRNIEAGRQQKRLCAYIYNLFFGNEEADYISACKSEYKPKAVDISIER